MPAVPVLRSTDTVALPLLATARSGLPSPFMSPMLTAKGPVPVVKSTLAAKLTVPAVPVLRSTDTVLLP